MPDHRDSQLDDYLAGRSEVSRVYRQLPADLPSPTLDEKIQAAARRELQRRRPRWLRPLSAAAIMLLSLGVLLRLQETGVPGLPMETPATLQEAVETQAKGMHKNVPKAADSTGFAASTTAPDNAQESATPPSVPERLRRIEPDATQLPETRVQPPQVPASKPEGMMQPQSESMMSAPARTDDASAAEEDRVEPPQAWIERIRVMHAQGRYPQAQAELKAFKTRYPDYPVPDDLKE
jgi:hypothetical protein